MDSGEGGGMVAHESFFRLPARCPSTVIIYSTECAVSLRTRDNALSIGAAAAGCARNRSVESDTSHGHLRDISYTIEL